MLISPSRGRLRLPPQEGPGRHPCSCPPVPSSVGRCPGCPGARPSCHRRSRRGQGPDKGPGSPSPVCEGHSAPPPLPPHGEGSCKVGSGPCLAQGQDPSIWGSMCRPPALTGNTRWAHMAGHTLTAGHTHIAGHTLTAGTHSWRAHTHGGHTRWGTGNPPGVDAGCRGNCLREQLPAARAVWGWR